MKDDAGLELNIKKLLAGRIDVVIEDPNVFHTKAKEMGVDDQIVEAGLASEPDSLFIAFAPTKDTSKKLAEIASAGIKRLKESGEMKKLMDKYGIKDLDKK